MRVSTLLGWDDLKFFEFQQKCASQYMQECMSRQPELMDKILEDQYFWDLWFELWEIRDSLYLESIEFCAYLGIEEDYKIFNAPNQLKIMIHFPNFMDSYNKKIGIR